MKSKVAFLLVAALATFLSSVDAQCCGEKKPVPGSDAQVAQNPAAPETTLSTGTLVALLGARAPMTLIDARANPTDVLPEAKVLTDEGLGCTKTLARTCGSKDRLIVTYCSGPKCSASSKAAAKLRAVGYTNVIEYRDGVEGWKKAGMKSGKSCCGTCGGSCGGGNGDDAGAAVCPVTGKSAKADRSGKNGKSGCTSCPAMQAKAASAPVSVIHTAVLKTLQDADVPMVILDARSGQFDDGNRIPGAVAFHCADCVGKPETLKKVAPGKNQLVITYCNGQKCPLSTKLARSLRDAGYTNVIDYKAGMAGWKKAGLKTVSQKAQCCGSCGDAQACSKKKSDGSSCPSGSCSGK
jgi:rhodanese-related sulfurtransferase